MNKSLAIAAVLTAVALTGIISTNPMAAYADESETNTEQKLKQENIGSGESTNFNCGTNQIDTIAAITTCGIADGMRGFVDGKLVEYD